MKELFAALFDFLGYCPSDAPEGSRTLYGEKLARTRAAFRVLVEEEAAIEGKYGLITASRKKFHPGEPVFLLRATDRKAPEAIYHYAILCKQIGCSEEHVDAALSHGDRIREWQLQNPELVKNPD